MFAINKVNVDASCHRNTLAFLSFHSSQITRRVRLLPAFRETVVDVVIMSHQSCTDEYGLHTLGCQFGCSAQVDTYSQILVYLQCLPEDALLSPTSGDIMGSLGCAPNRASLNGLRSTHVLAESATQKACTLAALKCAKLSLGALLWWILRTALCMPRPPCNCLTP